MKALPLAVVAALVLVSSASSAPDFTLRPVSKTGKTVTLSWKRQPGADGYAFLRNGIVVARTMNPSQTTATFWKGSRYAVAVLHVAAGGRVTRGARAVYTAPRAKTKTASTTRGTGSTTRLVFVPAPSPVFELRLVGRTAKTVTFAWKSQPGADGYRFLRNGTVVARTMNTAVTTATFWKGSRYAVDALRLASGKNAIPFRRAKALVRSATTQKRASKLVFVPARAIDFRLRLSSRTNRTLTFTWKRQPLADGYRFVRNGVVVAKTFDPSTTTATFWKGSRYEVDAIRLSSGKRVTTVMRALAYTRSSSGPNAGAGKSGTGATAPASSGGTAPPAQKPVSSPKAPTSSKAPTTPKSPSAPKTPTAPKPQTPAPTSPPPAASPPPTPTPSPPAVGPGGAVTLSGSYSPSAFFQAVAVAPAGPVTVRGSYTITGNVAISRSNLRIEGATVQGEVDFGSGASGSSLVDSSAMGFSITGADNILLQGNTFDGQGRNNQNIIWDQPAGNTPDGFVIRGNVFRNFYIDGGDVHSEALYIGYSTNGLIENNTFTNNGNTSHIFFTWFGNTANPATSYPRNMCVRGNTFGPTHGAYYDVNLRGEIPVSANIKVQRDATLAIPAFYGDC
jgi:hypothetical protein